MKKTRTLTLTEDQSALIINSNGKIEYDIPMVLDDEGQGIRSVILLTGLVNILCKDEVLDLMDDEIERSYKNAEKILSESKGGQ